MNDIIDVSELLLPKDRFDDSCRIMMSKRSFESLERGDLSVSINASRVVHSKIYNFKAIIRNEVGTLLFNVVQGNISVDVGEKVKGKFDFRLFRNSHVSIGLGTTSGSTMIFCKDSQFSCGKDCMFSTGVVVQSSDQHGLVDLSSGEITNLGNKKVAVGDHVWLGRAVTLTSGSSVEDGSVIAIGSVVTKRIGAHVIAAGVPAKVIKQNYTWCRSPDALDDYSRSAIALMH